MRSSTAQLPPSCVPLLGTTRGKTAGIIQELRDAIVRGLFAVGEFIANEKDLAEHFGVSRPSLREALRVLEGEGLICVTTGIHGGTFALEPDERLTARATELITRTRQIESRDVAETLALLEGCAARHLAVSAHNHKHAAVLHQHCAADRDAVNSSDAMERARPTFRQQVVLLTGLETLAILATTLARLVESTACRTDDGASPSPATSSLAQERRLASFVEAGDSIAAEEFWHRHVRAVLRVGEPTGRTSDTRDSRAETSGAAHL